MTETKMVSFDSMLSFSLMASGDREMTELPSGEELLKKYPETASWDRRILATVKKDSHAGHPKKVIRRILIIAAVLITLFTGAVLTSADVRNAIIKTFMKWTGVDLQLTYQVDSSPVTTLPSGFTDHYIPSGFSKNINDSSYNSMELYSIYENADLQPKGIYNVDCYVITNGSIETFDNEHTTYITMKIGSIDATLGTSSNFDGSTSYYLFWETDGIHYTVSGNLSLNEIVKIAEGIY